MNKLLVIIGPTATGKTDLALRLAALAGGELVACDSRQVYKGLDIGTGKMSSSTTRHPELDSGSNFEIPKQVRNDIKKDKGFWEIDEVKIWMYDVVSLRKQYSVSEYVKDANRVIAEIWKRGNLPIIVGGTGLYLRALLEGLSNLSIPVDKNLRRHLDNLSLKQLQIRLKQLSPERWEKLNGSDRQNPRRLIRAIELSLSSLRVQQSNLGRMNPKSSLPRPFGARNDVLKIGLTAPRDVLYKRVDERVLDWIDQGILEEVKELSKNGVGLKRFKELGLEYSLVARCLEGEITDENLIKKMQVDLHGYVRRQLTWFKKESQVNWFDITNKSYLENIEILVSSWYHNLNDKKN